MEFPQSIDDTEFDSLDTLKLKISTIVRLPSTFIEIVSEEEITDDESMYDLVHRSYVHSISTKFSGKINVYQYPDKIFNLINDRNLNLDEAFENIAMDIKDFIMMYRKMLDGEIDIETLNEVNNLISKYVIEEIVDTTKFDSVLQFETEYRNWSDPRRLQEIITKEKEKLDKLMEMQNSLSRIEKPEHTTLKRNRTTFRYDTIDNVGIIQFDRAIDIFNDSIVTMKVPYIQYNTSSTSEKEDPREKYYKLYNGVDLQMIKKNVIHFYNKDTIYILYVHDERIIPINIKFTESGVFTFISIDSDIRGEDVIAVLEGHFKLKFINPKEINVSAEFEIYGYMIFETTFIHEVTNNKLFSNYMYIDESKEPASRKQRLKFHFKDNSSSDDDENKGLSFTLTQLFVKPEGIQVDNLDEVFDMEDEVLKTLEVVNGNVVSKKNYSFQSGHPYVLVNITKSTETLHIQKFIGIITRLIHEYSLQEMEINNYYSAYIPEYVPRYIQQKTKFKQLMNIKAPSATGSRVSIMDLKRSAKDLIVDGYAGKCNPKRAPRIIPSEKLEEWLTTNPIFVNGVPMYRQVMVYPKGANGYNIVCPGDEYPYPGLKENTLSNKGTYKYIPCCYKEDQSSYGKKTMYNEYYREEEQKLAQKSKGYKIKTGKVLKPDRLGNVPQQVEGIFLFAYPGIPASSINRMGVYISNDSMLHCILRAIDSPDYENAEDKEMYVKKLRVDISKSIAPQILKQELWDLSLEEITSEIANPNVFLDSKRYFRALEEFFNVNIFVFSSIKKRETKEKLILVTMETPRHKFSHISSKNVNRGNIVLLKHKGTKGDNVEYPQYELINILTEQGMFKLFDAQVFNVCNRVYQITNESFNMSFDQCIDENDEKAPCVRLREKMDTDLLSTFSQKVKVTGQHIDRYGKTRAILINSIVAWIPPTYPRDLPVVDVFNVHPQIEDVTKIFGTPSFAETDEVNIVGLWFKVFDINDGIYCPIANITIDSIENIERCRKFVTSITESQTKRVKRIQKLLDKLMQLYKWICILHLKDSGKFETIDDFFTVVEQPGEDSLNLYDVSGLGRYFPVANNVNEALRGIFEKTKGVVTETDKGLKFKMYSKDFYDKVKYSLRRFFMDIYGVGIGIPVKFSKFYSDPSDFREDPNAKIIIGENDFEEWIVYSSRENEISVVTKIDITSMINRIPFILIVPSINRVDTPLGSMYLVQNVQGGDKLSAINVAITWNNSSINLGYYARRYESPLNIETREVKRTNIPKHIVYSISPSSLPMLTVDQSDGSDSYIELLNYGGEKYAALLRIV